MIASVVVDGIRVFNRRTELPMRPITLVYGPNSAGKSTLLESLKIAIQTFSARRPRYGMVSSGPLTDSHEYPSIVAGHDLARQVTLGFSVSGRSDLGVNGTFLWDEKRRAALLRSTTIRVGSHEVPFVHRVRQRSRQTVDAPLHYLAVSPDYERNTSGPFGTPPAPWEQSGISPLFHLDGNLPGTVFDWVTPSDESRLPDTVLRRLASTWDSEWLPSIDELRLEASVLSLGPLRRLGDEVLLLRGDDQLQLGREGSGTTPLLARSQGLTSAVGLWLQRLGVSYTPLVQEITSATNRHALGDVVALLLEDQRSGVQVLPTDVGFGVSQLLPIVAAALAAENSLIMVEQPEIHLHPRLQAELAELFIESAARRSNQFLLETHSEHLLLRLRRRIRDGSLDPSLLAVLYVDPLPNGEVVASVIEVDDDGEFIDPWPQGFFEERIDELFD